MSACFCVGPPGNCPCVRQREYAQNYQKDLSTGCKPLVPLTEYDVRRIVREELEKGK